MLLQKLDAFDNYLMSHSANVCYLAILLGLKLERYLIDERPVKHPHEAKDVEEAARRYSENFQRAAAAQNSGDYSRAEDWHRANLKLVESTPGVPSFVRVLPVFRRPAAVAPQRSQCSSRALP